jgi:rhodanese-related sulfurtransferase
MSLSEPLSGLFAKGFEEINVFEAKGAMDDGAILVDVREPAEWAAGHVEGARHIPLAQLGQRQRELPVGRPVITVCRSGARSARAATLLAGQGREVSNLDGGMRAWAAAGLPVVTEGGLPGAVI